MQILSQNHFLRINPATYKNILLPLTNIFLTRSREIQEAQKYFSFKCKKIFYHNLFFIYLWAKYHFLEKVIFIWVSKSQPKIILVYPTKIAKNKSNTRRKRNFLLIILINIFIWSFLLEKCNEDPYRSKYTTVFLLFERKGLTNLQK